MNQLSNKEIAKVFAMYLGCEVSFDNEDETTGDSKETMKHYKDATTSRNIIQKELRLANKVKCKKMSNTYLKQQS